MSPSHRGTSIEVGSKRISLVLGGGGMKGFAHIGVMRALQERGIMPSLFAGTSIGALLGAAWAGGMSVADLSERAISLRRRDLFRINHLGMIKDRMNAESIYLEGPLRALVEAAVPPGNFAEFGARLFVNTVDLERATQIVWGTPGLDHVSMRNAVYASCALPGFFPPGRVDGRLCIDGGVVDNLPVQVAALWSDVIIAVDVGSTEVELASEVQSRGFANTYMRAASTMMHALQQVPLTRWSGPPMVLIRPRCPGGWLGFASTEQTIDAGYRAAISALADFESHAVQDGGVFPRRNVEIEVAAARCTGCGLCAAMAPGLMGLGAAGRAFARTRIVEWSPADGDFVQACPAGAIVARTIAAVTRPAVELAS